MTVIAWDGLRMVGDRMTVSGGHVTTMKKVRKIRGHLVGVCGSASAALEYMKWFEDGADPATLPAGLRGGESYMLVITPERKILSYEGGPYPVEVEETYHAHGSGRDYAHAAMHLGFDAYKAVEVASELSVNCGRGWDAISFEED
jgi:ATP-dependent protease HslVU (ClpYQ) peptidase subunit